MVQPDVMKEDGCHQNISFTEPANIQKHEIILSWNDTCDESGWEIGSLAYGWGGEAWKGVGSIQPSAHTYLKIQRR